MSSIYDVPETYEALFSYRDLMLEAKFCRDEALKWIPDVPTSLDVACGYGGHVSKFIALGIDSYGIDKSRNMVRYAVERVGIGRIRTCDMRKIATPPKPFSLMTVLMDSVSHLLNTKDLERFFYSARGSAAPGGVLIIETGFRRSLRDHGFGNLSNRTVGEWEFSMNGILGLVKWAQRPMANSCRNCKNNRVTIECPLTGRADKMHAFPTRDWSVAELQCAANNAGFYIRSLYGGFERDLPFASPKAWRTILLFQA